MRPLSIPPRCDIVRGMSAPQNKQEVPAPDSAAANAAVAVGDVWWDTTANKPRVRLC